jgi:hypothetical protein
MGGDGVEKKQWRISAGLAKGRSFRYNLWVAKKFKGS